MDQIARVTKKYYCGIDLHAEMAYLCIMNAAGKVVLHDKKPTESNALIAALEPYIKSIVVGVESTYNWYWLADMCADYNICFCLGHALYIKRIIGKKHANDKRDSYEIANLLRNQNFPLAYPYPAGMREARDLLRRRTLFVRRRAGIYSHIKATFRQQGMQPPKLMELQRKSDRRNLIDAFENTHCRFTLTCDFNYIESMDKIINDTEKEVRNHAQQHDRALFALLHTIPGCGDMMALTILYEMHTVKRFATVQDFCSYCRVVKAQRDSAGKRKAGGGNGESKIGNPNLKWAFSEIASHAIIYNQPIRKYYDKLKRKFGIAKAMARLEHRLAVAVYSMLKNGTGFDDQRFFAG